jgi:hypothetical protein
MNLAQESTVRYASFCPCGHNDFATRTETAGDVPGSAARNGGSRV